MMRGLYLGGSFDLVHFDRDGSRYEYSACVGDCCDCGITFDFVHLSRFDVLVAIVGDVSNSGGFETKMLDQRKGLFVIGVRTFATAFSEFAGIVS